MDLSKSVIRLHHSLVCGNDSILHLTIVFKATKTEKVATLKSAFVEKILVSALEFIPVTF